MVRASSRSLTPPAIQAAPITASCSAQVSHPASLALVKAVVTLVILARDMDQAGAHAGAASRSEK